MHQQLSLDGLGPPSRPPRRMHEDALFFAVRPDEAASRRLVEVGAGTSRRYDLVGRAMPAERLHLSLRGTMAPRRMIDGAAEELATLVQIDLDAFTFAVDYVKSFRSSPGSWPLVATGTSPELVDVHAGLHRALLRSKFDGAIGKHFQPHVTLFWASSQVRDQAIPPIGWTVR